LWKKAAVMAGLRRILAWKPFTAKRFWHTVPMGEPMRAPPTRWPDHTSSRTASPHAVEARSGRATLDRSGFDGVSAWCNLVLVDCDELIPPRRGTTAPEYICVV
jgi:hypothetical protein